MGTQNLDYKELSQKIDLTTGGLNASVHISDNPQHISTFEQVSSTVGHFKSGVACEVGVGVGVSVLIVLVLVLSKWHTKYIPISVGTVSTPIANMVDCDYPPSVQC